MKYTYNETFINELGNEITVQSFVLNKDKKELDFVLVGPYATMSGVITVEEAKRLRDALDKAINEHQ